MASRSASGGQDGRGDGRKPSAPALRSLQRIGHLRHAFEDCLRLVEFGAQMGDLLRGHVRAVLRSRWRARISSTPAARPKPTAPAAMAMGAAPRCRRRKSVAALAGRWREGRARERQSRRIPSPSGTMRAACRASLPKFSFLLRSPPSARDRRSTNPICRRITNTIAGAGIGLKGRNGSCAILHSRTGIAGNPASSRRLSPNVNKRRMIRSA